MSSNSSTCNYSKYRQWFPSEIRKRIGSKKAGYYRLFLDPSTAQGGILYPGDDKQPRSTFFVDQEETSQRREFLGRRGKTIAAVGQHIPLPASTIDLALDVYGPAYYAPDISSLQNYLGEAFRVLKPGKSLHIVSMRIGEKSLGPEQTRELLGQAGFTQVDIFEDGIDGGFSRNRNVAIAVK